MVIMPKRCHWIKKMRVYQHSPQLFNGRRKNTGINSVRILLLFVTLFSSSIYEVWCSNPDVPPTSRTGYKILSEEIVYERWRKVIQRKVQMPNGKIVDYDVSVININYIVITWIYSALFLFSKNCDPLIFVFLIHINFFFHR